MAEPEIVSTAPYRSLSQRLTDGYLPLGEALQYAITLAESLRKLHDAGLAHGAISPRSIAMNGAGLEFLPASRSSASAPHAAPEVRYGQAAAPPSDVFSFGVVLEEMIAGCRPIDRLVALCQAREPGARPPIRRVAAELRLILVAVRNHAVNPPTHHSHSSIATAARRRSVKIRFTARRLWGTGKSRYALLGAALTAFGFVAGYARTAGNVADYNALLRETDTLRSRYQNLERVLDRTDDQMASLKVYAREVSVAYGIDPGEQRISKSSLEGPLSPTLAESLDEYTLLRAANHLSLPIQRGRMMPTASASPSVWPVDGGRIIGGFGERIDPFSGEGAFHTGVDISGAVGAPVRATADGTVVYAQWQSGYGKVVVIDHGGDVQTLYAHLSRYFVNVGEIVTRGQYVGAVGATGKATAAHLHYEVRLGGAAVNPYVYHLAKSVTYLQAPRENSLF